MGKKWIYDKLIFLHLGIVTQGNLHCGVTFFYVFLVNTFVRINAIKRIQVNGSIYLQLLHVDLYEFVFQCIFSLREYVLLDDKKMKKINGSTFSRQNENNLYVSNEHDEMINRVSNGIPLKHMCSHFDW